MQTFLPYPDYEKSASVLDDDRLNNQINEALIILRSNVGYYDGDGWRHHPAAKMWVGHERSLYRYALAFLHEWLSRKPGEREEQALSRAADFATIIPPTDNGRPGWLGREDFHESHQANLVGKDADHYNKFFSDVNENMDYVWPSGRRA